jgi:predicted transcriptional regulator
MSQEDILEVLHKYGDMTAKEITDKVSESYSAIQRSLRKMRKYRVLEAQMCVRENNVKQYLYRCIKNDKKTVE